jgi:hypothetical protein
MIGRTLSDWSLSQKEAIKVDGGQCPLRWASATHRLESRPREPHSCGRMYGKPRYAQIDAR